MNLAARIAQKIEDIKEGVEMAISEPVQYIQYQWDNSTGEVAEFWPYTPQQWFGEWEPFVGDWKQWNKPELLPNLQNCSVKGRCIKRNELEAFIRDKTQPEGAVIS